MNEYTELCYTLFLPLLRDGAVSIVSFHVTLPPAISTQYPIDFSAPIPTKLINATYIHSRQQPQPVVVEMYQPDEGKPPAYAATGFPVNYNGGAAAYNNSTTTTTNSTAPYSTISADSDQPPPPPRPLEDWSTGLCDCCTNIKNCCITCWCPCVTFGQVAEIVDKGSTSCGASGALYTLVCCLIGCGCLYSCFYRSKMRQQYSLRGNGCTDCLVHCCCEPCALCQEYRELQNRGFDMVIGWHGNVEQRSRGIAMTATAPPTAEHGMSR